MYLVRESSPDHYFVDYKVGNKFIESYYVSFNDTKADCSCKHFHESHNRLNHFHINLVEYWIKEGKPSHAIYEKAEDGKIKVLCHGTRN